MPSCMIIHPPHRTKIFNMENESASFLLLPAELRIMIYSYAMDEDGTRDFPYQAIVEDLSPRKYRVEKRRVYQTAYQLVRHQDVPCPLHCQPNSTCKTTSSMPTTSYKVTHMTVPQTDYNVPGLLGVCHLVRREALFLFYRNSTIQFRSMSAVMPFMNDRPGCLHCFRSFGFHLNLDWHGHSSPAHQQWVQVFNKLAEGLPLLRLQHLFITVIDPDRHCLVENFMHTRKLLHWIHALAEIRGLESVRARFEFREREAVHGEQSMWSGPGDWADWTQYLEQLFRTKM